MSIGIYALIFLAIPIVIALIYDLNKIIKKKRKAKEAQWDCFISEKYNEMKMWNPDVKYDDVKKMVMKSVNK
jgi:hypothetical protein